VVSTGGTGTISRRQAWRDAKTPWEMLSFFRGGGMRAMMRCSNSLRQSWSALLLDNVRQVDSSLLHRVFSGLGPCDTS